MPRSDLGIRHADELPKLPESHDVHAVIYLLEYARARGFRIGPVLEIGTVRLQVADIRQAMHDGPTPTPAEPGDFFGAAGLTAKDEPEPGTE